MIGTHVTADVVIPPVTPAAVITTLELDFVDTQSGEKSISQDDIQFL